LPTAAQLAQLKALRYDEVAASAALTSAVETERAVVSAARAAYAHAHDVRSAFEAAIWRGLSAPNVIDDRGGGRGHDKSLPKVCN